MIDIYLKAESEADLKAALPFAYDAESGWQLMTETYALDLIGGLVLHPAEIDEVGHIIKTAVFAEGFHANLRCTEEVAALIPAGIQITVTKPKRRFF